MKYTIQLLLSQARSLDEVAKFEDNQRLHESANEHREHAKELRDAASILESAKRV